MDSSMLFMLVIIVVMVLMMWWSSRKSKQQQAQVKDFRASLEPGTLVVTIGGIIGKVVSVDTKYEEIVIDSEGSLLRFKLSSVSKEYVRPAYIDDDEVDEDGNPIDGEDAGSDEDADIQDSAVAIGSSQSATTGEPEAAEHAEFTEAMDSASSDEDGKADAKPADSQQVNSDTAAPQTQAEGK